MTGQIFLVVTDADSKWLEVHPKFISWKFKNFLHKNGVEHLMSAPYHPATNGLVERAVWTFKGGVKKLKKGDIHTKLARFLFSYWITPQSTKESCQLNY